LRCLGTVADASQYGFEYWPDTSNGAPASPAVVHVGTNARTGYITWQANNQQAWTLNAAAIGPNPLTQVSQRLVSEGAPAVLALTLTMTTPRRAHVDHPQPGSFGLVPNGRLAGAALAGHHVRPSASIAPITSSPVTAGSSIVSRGRRCGIISLLTRAADVRVYQRTGQMNVGCDPKNRPTADYINKHLNAYTNPNRALSWPRRSDKLTTPVQ
jgi:hypothetical protein